MDASEARAPTERATVSAKQQSKDPAGLCRLTLTHQASSHWRGHSYSRPSVGIMADGRLFLSRRIRFLSRRTRHGSSLSHAYSVESQQPLAQVMPALRSYRRPSLTPVVPAAPAGSCRAGDCNRSRRAGRTPRSRRRRPPPLSVRTGRRAQSGSAPRRA
jgi:hypothetical protein